MRMTLIDDICGVGKQLVALHFEFAAVRQTMAHCNSSRQVPDGEQSKQHSRCNHYKRRNPYARSCTLIGVAQPCHAGGRAVITTTASTLVPATFRRTFRPTS